MSDPKTYTTADVAEILRGLVFRLKGQNYAADAIGIVPSYISQVINGHHNPGPAILDYFGMRKADEGVYVSALGESYIENKSTRNCEGCGDPLPGGSDIRRKYCDLCAHARIRSQKSEFRGRLKNRAPNPAIVKENLTRKHNPLAGIRKDYLELKLAGKIIIPKSNGKQINLKD